MLKNKNSKMQSFFLSSLNKCADYLKTQIYPESNAQNFKLIENQQKIIYFTAFDFDLSELEKTYSFVRTIKENLFKKVLQVTKYTIKEIVSIPNAQNEYQKIMILFSSCFLHYYAKFSYTKCPTFNDFYTKELMELCSKFNITIIHLNQFKVYCYSFYYQMINELNQLEYETIIKVSNYGFNANSENLSVNKIKEVVDRKIISAVVSAKERIIDMVYFFGNKKNETAYTPHIQPNTPHNNFANIKSNLFDIYSQTNTNDENDTVNTKNSKLCNNIIETTLTGTISSTSFNNDSDNMSSSNCSSNNDGNNAQFYSKRILSEMSKCTVDDKSKLIIDIVTTHIDISEFDEMINQNNYNIEMINPFICNVIEVKSGILLNRFNNVPDDYICRFIFIAKKMYIKALELFFTIYNLAYTETSTFDYITKIKFGLGNDKRRDNWGKCFLYFYKVITEEIKKQKEKEENCINGILERMQLDWKEYVIKKFQNLKTFCAFD